MSNRKKAPPVDIPPPSHLSDRAASLWRAVVPSRWVRSAGRLALLTEALTALDRADKARAIVDAEGMTTVTASTKAVHVHPACKLERENRTLFARIWHDQLHLHWDSDIDGTSFDRWLSRLAEDQTFPSPSPEVDDDD